jgi:hypothetical protein
MTEQQFRGGMDTLYEVEPNTGCWLWLRGQNNGYGQVNTLEEDGTWYPERAHRYSYKIYKGDIPSGAFICHSCGQSLCVNPAHLYCGTAKSNYRDAMNHGRAKIWGARGENNHSTKLSWRTVDEIRDKYRLPEYTQRSLAEEYGVSKATVQAVVEYRTWRHQ